MGKRSASPPLQSWSTDPDPDTGGGTGGVMVQLTVALTGIRDAVSDLVARQAELARRADVQPARHTAVASGPVVAGTPLVLDLATPSQGRYWIIRSLSVSDAGAVRTAVAGPAVVDWYIGRMGAAQTPSPSNWQWTFAGAPAVQTFTSDPVYLMPQDRLIAVITGATTAGQILLAKAELWDGARARFQVAQAI